MDKDKKYVFFFLQLHFCIEDNVSAYNLQLVQTYEGCGDAQDAPYDFNVITDIATLYQSERASVAWGDEVECISL